MTLPVEFGVLIPKAHSSRPPEPTSPAGQSSRRTSSCGPDTLPCCPTKRRPGNPRFEQRRYARAVEQQVRTVAADERAILDALQTGGARMWPRMREFDWAGRDADELAPQTYPEWR